MAAKKKAASGGKCVMLTPAQKRALAWLVSEGREVFGEHIVERVEYGVIEKTMPGLAKKLGKPKISMEELDRAEKTYYAPKRRG
jgi:hypothetical protein